MVRFVSVKSQSTPWIAISIWTCPIVQSEPRLKLKKSKDALECYNRIIQFHWQNHCNKKYRLDRKEGDFFYCARAVLTIMIWFNQKGFKSHPNLSQHRQTKFWSISFYFKTAGWKNCLIFFNSDCLTFVYLGMKCLDPLLMFRKYVYY